MYRACVLCVSQVMIHPKTGSCVQCVQCVYRACVLCVSQVMIHPEILPSPPTAPLTLYDRPSASDHRRAHCRRRWMWRRNWRRILLPCVGHCSDQSRDWQIFWALSAPPTGISLYILIILIKENVEWSLRFLTEVNHICLLFCHI